MLRGPQTLGELRNRTGRYVEFSDLDEIESELAALARKDEPRTERLQRQPGEKESRYRHLLGGSWTSAAPEKAPEPADPDRVAELETELNELRERVARMERELGLES